MDRFSNDVVGGLLKWCLDNKVILDFSREESDGTGQIKILLTDPVGTVTEATFIEAVNAAKEYKKKYARKNL